MGARVTGVKISENKTMVRAKKGEWSECTGGQLSRLWASTQLDHVLDA